MDLTTATNIIQNITDAMGGIARVVTVTVKPYKGHGSRSFRNGHVVAMAEGLVIRPEGPMARPCTPQSGGRKTADEALAVLVNIVRSAADDWAHTREATALTARNEAQIALSRAEDAELKASAMRAVLAKVRS